MIRPACAICAPASTLIPTPPTPNTATVSPGCTFAEPSTAPTPVTVAQPMIAVSSIDTSFASGSTICSCARTCSAQV